MTDAEIKREAERIAQRPSTHEFYPDASQRPVCRKVINDNPDYPEHCSLYEEAHVHNHVELTGAIIALCARVRDEARAEAEAVVIDKLHFAKTVLSNIKTGTAIADERHFGSKQVAFQEILDAIQKEQTQ